MRDNFEVITSIGNAKIKHVKKLADKSYRRSQGEFVIEGENLLKDLPSDVWVVSLFIQKDKFEEYEYIVNRHISSKIYLVDDKVMRAISNTVTPCGALATVKIPQQKSLIDGNVAVLDGINDPGNMGTIIRTCVACGIENLLALSSVDPYSPKVVRASMGGIFKVNIFEKNREDALKMLKNHQIYCLDMNGENLYKMTKVDSPFAIVVGSESQGVSDAFKRTGRIISLPMSGKIESLNAAVSMSVALYELCFCKKS